MTAGAEAKYEGENTEATFASRQFLRFTTVEIFFILMNKFLSSYLRACKKGRSSVHRTM